MDRPTQRSRRISARFCFASSPEINPFFWRSDSVFRRDSTDSELRALTTGSEVIVGTHSWGARASSGGRDACWVQAETIPTRRTARSGLNVVKLRFRDEGSAWARNPQ